MSQYKDIAVGSTVYFWFAANTTAGAAGDGATPLYDVRLAGASSSGAPTASGTPTLLTHANYTDGLHEIAIDTTGYAAGEYAVFCTLTISSVNPAGFCGSFTVRAASATLYDLAVAVKAKTDLIPASPALEGTLTTIAGYLDTEVAAIKAKTDLIPAAPAATGDIPTASAIADQVWDELTAGHAVAGSTGAAIVAAGSAGDPWSTSVPGAYGAGTAGNILGNRLDVASSTLATTAALTTVDDFLDTEITAIKAKTDLIPATPAAVSDIPTAADITTTVWAAGTRTLTGFGTLIADIWAAATRTLTAISDSSGVTTLLSRITVAPPTAAQVSTAVWGEDLSTANQDGTLAGGYVLRIRNETTGVNENLQGLQGQLVNIEAKTDLLPASPASEGTLTTIASYLDTEVTAIKAKTDNLPAAPAATGDVPTAAANAIAVWAAVTRTLTAISDSAGVGTLLARPSPPLAVDIAAAVWNQDNGSTSIPVDSTAYQLRHMPLFVHERVFGEPDFEDFIETPGSFAAAIAAIPTTPVPTAAAIRAEMDSNSTDLDALLAAVNAVDAPTAAEITAAVWSNVARTLTDKTGFALATAPPTAAELVLALLRFDMQTLTGEAAFSPANALRFLRNAWNIDDDSQVLTVYKEDGATAAWTRPVVSTPGADPVTGVE